MQLACRSEVVDFVRVSFLGALPGHTRRLIEGGSGCAKGLDSPLGGFARDAVGLDRPPGDFARAAVGLDRPPLKHLSRGDQCPSTFRSETKSTNRNPWPLM